MVWSFPRSPGDGWAPYLEAGLESVFTSFQIGQLSPPQKSHGLPGGLLALTLSLCSGVDTGSQHALFAFNDHSDVLIADEPVCV